MFYSKFEKVDVYYFPKFPFFKPSRVMGTKEETSCHTLSSLKTNEDLGEGPDSKDNKTI